VHRLTQPATPTTTGKVERFHQTLRRDLLADHEPFADLEDVQAALDDWVEGDYNTRRPHRSLEMASPADRFAPVPALERDALPLRLPAALAAAPAPAPSPEDGPAPEPVLRVPALVPGAVEFDRVVPASGNLAVAGKQFWLGPDRAGITVSFWADHDVIHLLVAGARIKSVRSHLSTADLQRLGATGGRPAGPPPLPAPDGDGAAVEVDRVVSAGGTVGLGGRVVLAAEILGGRRVTIRIDDTSLVFFDPETRELLRTRPSPFTHDQATRLHGARPAGPHPGPPSNRSGSSAGPPTEASSWSPARKSPSADSTPEPPSPSTGPRPPSPSKPATTPEPSPAPPPSPSATSDPSGPARPPHRNLGLLSPIN
jgi:Integrase core domain